jgi:putative transposase
MAEAYRISDQHAPYFITLTIIDWVDIFTRKEYKDIVVDSLNYCIENKGLCVYEYVIMSNHIHAIVSSSQPNALSDTIRDLKKFTSKRILDSIQIINESRKVWLLNKFSFAGRRNLNNTNYQVWVQDYHAVELRDKDMWEQRTEYIHQNPVRAGIVERAEDYLYSSAGKYFNKSNLVKLNEK